MTNQARVIRMDEEPMIAHFVNRLIRTSHVRFKVFAIRAIVAALIPLVLHMVVTPSLDALDAVSTKAEGGLDSEAEAIKQQARKIKPLKEKGNLLKTAPAPSLPTHNSEKARNDNSA